MKKFTIKDFLKLNSPCFGCNGAIDVHIGVTNIDLTIPDVYLKPSITLQYITVPLVINYNSGLKLVIDGKTNKFSSSDSALLTKYLESHKLFLSCRCSACNTTFVSYHLEFNLQHGFIKPVAILREFIILQDKMNRYQIQSIFSQETTQVTVFKMDQGSATAVSNMDLPIIARYRFRDREHMMNKLRTYLLFS